MKKLLFLFIAIFFCLMNLNAQSTTDIYPQPERYVVMVHPQTSIYSVFLDSQTGIIKIISGWSHSSYVANRKDLTDGKPTKMADSDYFCQMTITCWLIPKKVACGLFVFRARLIKRNSSK